MVMHYEMPNSQGEVFVVRPNNSLKWQHAKWLFNSIAVVMLGIAMIFWSLGAWLVFPFVVVELLVLAFGFYRASLKAYSKEVISIESQSIRIQQGPKRPEFQLKLPSVQVTLRKSPGGQAPAHLYLQSAESEVEVGGCLIEAEREALADDLSRAVAACRFPGGSSIAHH